MSTITACVAGAIIGLIYGGLIGLIKYVCLWKNVIKTEKELTMGVLYIRMGIGYAVNILTLLLVFLIRNAIPLNFMATLLAAAVGLSLAGKLAPMTRIIDHVKQEKPAVSSREDL